MKTFPRLLISGAAACLALAAQAGTAMNASEMGRITNGGTGYIGLTQSAGQPRPMEMAMEMASTQAVSRIPVAAGEASTMVDGHPNQDPDAPAKGSMTSANAELRSMGHTGAAPAGYGPMGPLQQRGWGTPD